MKDFPCCPACGHAVPVQLHVFTDPQLKALAASIAAEVLAGPRPEAVSVAEAARLLGIGEDALRYRIKAGVVAVLPDLGPIRISMAEIDRLNGR